MTIEFERFNSIARLNREMTITEKIDGTNSAIVFAEPEIISEGITPGLNFEVANIEVAMQSRNRLITPKEDNHGFAKWVAENVAELYRILGPGRHYGEFWGSGINRGYGLPKGEKRFSLFNVGRWADEDLSSVPGLGVVPTLYQGAFDTNEIESVKAALKANGSVAAPGYMNPEGVVVYHKAANMLFKTTYDACDSPDWDGGKTWSKQR